MKTNINSVYLNYQNSEDQNNTRVYSTQKKLHMKSNKYIWTIYKAFWNYRTTTTRPVNKNQSQQNIDKNSKFLSSKQYIVRKCFSSKKVFFFKLIVCSLLGVNGLHVLTHLLSCYSKITILLTINWNRHDKKFPISEG